MEFLRKVSLKDGDFYIFRKTADDETPNCNKCIHIGAPLGTCMARCGISNYWNWYETHDYIAEHELDDYYEGGMDAVQSIRDSIEELSKLG